MSKKIQFNYTFLPALNQSYNAFPNAYTKLTQNKQYIQKEATAYIASKVASATAPFVNFTYDLQKCERDVGYILDAYAHDLRYNGNIETRKIVSYYYTANGIPLLDGNLAPEIDVHTWIRNLINNNILPNVAYSSLQTEVTQNTSGSAGEGGASSRITTLAGILTGTLTNGFSSLPAAVTGNGRQGQLTIEGNTALRRLLIITNVTKGQIIYNFADSTKTAQQYYINRTNQTVIILNSTTDTMGSTDELQFFVEEDDVRMEPSGTFADPVDKLRVSQPQSLIDTDFEYSLQSSKWETVETVSNIPNVFIQANQPSFTTDQISSIVVNPSTGIVTVTTTVAHGRVIGDPVILKETANERFSDGAFLVLSVPTATTFTFQGNPGISLTPTAPTNQPQYAGSGAITSGATTITLTSLSGGLTAANLNSISGYAISGTGILVRTTISSVNTATNTITISNALTLSRSSGNYRISPYGSSELTLQSSDVGGAVSTAYDLGTYQAASGNNSIAIRGQWDSVGDNDYYKFTLSEQAVLHVDAASNGANDTFFLELFSANASGETRTDTLQTGSLPSWLQFISRGFKPTLNTHYGIDGAGMWISGNSWDGGPAYPVATNFTIDQNVRVRVFFRIVWNDTCADHGVCVYVDGTTPNWNWGTDSSRIAYQFNCNSPWLVGRFQQSSNYTPFLQTGVEYDIEFIYDPTSNPAVTARIYSTGGTLLETRTINEVLPAGAYRVGFDADQDSLGIRSYFKNMTITTGAGTTAIVNYGSVTAVNASSTLEYGNNIIAVAPAGAYYARVALNSTSGSTPDSYQLNIHQGFYTSTNLRTDSTAIYSGGFYSNARITGTINTISGTLNAQVSTTVPHNLFYGSPIYVIDTGLINADWVGSFSVLRVIDDYTFTYRTDATVNWSNNNIVSTTATSLYTRMSGVSIHRSLDGGVQINPGSNAPYKRILRQTRKYFRYQSGKGLQFNNGFLFKPNYNITTLEVVPDPDNPPASSLTPPTYFVMRITTEQEHGFANPIANVLIGASITIDGYVVDSGVNPYNNNFIVSKVNSSKQFEVKIGPVSGITDYTPGGIGVVYVKQWYDSVVRNGIYDDQNGLFFECDGDDLWAVRRYSTTQLPGTVTVNPGSGVVTGNNTRFRSQVKVGDYIALRGYTYLVAGVPDDTNLIISPRYSGVAPSSTVKAALVVEERTPRSRFNLDTVNGLGPSGYNLDLNKMQMNYIDYSWYGAGKIRYGFRSTDGSIKYVHEYRTNNVNNEAYMRSGNLPGRFEIQNRPAITTLTANFTEAATTPFTMSVSDCSKFPPFGICIVNNEYFRYTRTNNTQLAIQQRTYPYGRSVAVPGRIGDAVISFNCNFSAALSHWGTAVIMDGRFDEDKSYLFTAVTGASVFMNNTTLARPILSIRLSPSADYGIPRDFGVRSLINRSAIILKEIGMYTRGTGYQITARINAQSAEFRNQTNWREVGNGSISQYFDHSLTSSTVTGGDLVAAFFADQGDNRFAVTRQEIDTVRELTNSVLGGNQIYPDGPDILTIFAQPFPQVGSGAEVRCRISWQESQG